MTYIVAACLTIAFASSDAMAIDDSADRTWVCSLDRDAGTSNKLFSVPQAVSANSLAVSPDGVTFAYSGTLSHSDTETETRIWTCDAAGDNVQDLGRGTLPSWSPGGKRLVFSRVAPEPGVWLMRVDGSDQQILDASGWGAAWSPNGRQIAWFRTINGQINVVLYDVAEDDFDIIDDCDDFPADGIRSRITWSPDSQRLCLQSVSESGIGRFHSAEVGQPEGDRFSFERRVAEQSSAVWISPGTIAIGDELITPPPFPNSQPVETTPIEALIAGRRNEVAAAGRGGRLLFYLSVQAGQPESSFSETRSP